MSKVSVTINGRAFTIGCEEGQEPYLRELAGYLDGKVHSMSDQVGQIGDLRLLLMAALIVVDELKEAERKGEALTAQIDRLGADGRGIEDHFAGERVDIASRLVTAAERLEALADAAEDAVNAQSGQSPEAVSDDAVDPNAVISGAHA
jgi:cell division protein ZapA